MRPLKLIMTGFGTYLERTEIDFSKLGEKGLYIITGDTGSGKTTIFDAITFALFGCPSGQLRQASMFRTNFAGPDDLTEVELTFEYRDKIYKIRRNPKYPRRDKRNPDKLVDQEASATLFLPDGKVVENKKGHSVTDEIEEILGLDAKKFHQIVMIAQGEFQELIKQNTEGRIEIFRELFGTQKYELLCRELGEESSKLNKEREILSASLNNFMNSTSLSSQNKYFKELEEAKIKDNPWDEKIALLEKIVSEDKENLNELQNKMDTCEGKLDKVKKELVQMEEVKKLSNELKEKKNQIDQLSNNLTVCKERLDKEIASKGETEKLKKEYNLAEANIAKYDEFDLVQKEISVNDAFINQKSLEIQDNQAKVSQLEEEIKIAENKLKELKSEEDKSLELNNEEKDLKSKKEEFLLLEDNLKALESDFTSLQKAQEDFQKALSLSSQKREEYEALNKAYLFEQAGILAEALKDNEACPVCGSLHHPAPAKKSKDAPGKEELNAIKSQLDELEKNSQHLSEASAVMAERFENIMTNVGDKINKLLAEKISIPKEDKTLFDSFYADMSQKIFKEKENIQNHLLKVQQEILIQVEKKEKIKALEENNPILRENKSKLENKKVELISQRQEKEIENKNNRKKVEELKKVLEFESKALAQKNLDEKKNQIELRERALDNAQKAFDSSSKEETALQAKIQQLQDSLNKAPKIESEKNEEELSALENQKSLLTEEIKNVNANYSKNISNLEEIKKSSLELEKVENRYKAFLELYKTAAGNLGNKTNKLKLETYIQMTYFDRILAFANTRYLLMTDGQYEMARDSAADAQSQSGLEIKIIDHWNGGQRSIKSLSGGEQFQASLSLALGLSDEIAYSAGGIRLDSLFVDEGFGSLDSETANKAFKALSSIAENNRLVGLISHIDLLKSKIDDKQILVSKRKNKGSFA
ncbi:MAG: SMC family ATPase, partial [Treponema sp.]|nr:SMC family ATPase [Treponema sp.]